MRLESMVQFFNYMSGMALIPVPHRRLFVDPGRVLDVWGLEHTYLTLAAAEEAAIANQHDEVCIVSGSSSNTLSAAMTWDKSYTHLTGACAPTGVGQRARIFQLATLAAASPLLNITSNGGIFANFYLFQGVNDATSLINVQVTGGRNYFENVHFAGCGHTAHAINDGASLKLNGAAENTFKGCTIGVDTVAAATGTMALLLDGYAVRNIFKECNFTLYAGSTGVGFVEVVDNTGIDRYNIFQECKFLNMCRTYAVASAFVIPTAMASVTNYLILDRCEGLGMTTWDANDRGVLVGNMNAVTAADLSGVAVGMYA